MVAPASPLGGFLGATTCSVYAIDPISGTPFEPIPDLLPGVFTPLRVTLDMVSSEDAPSEAVVTEHAIPDFLDVTSHVHLPLRRLNITGVLIAGMKSPPAELPESPAPFVRLDLLRVDNLRRLQRLRQPLMVVTPRNALAKCFLTGIAPSWASEDGERTTIALSFTEARVVSPELGVLLPDYPAQVPGNNSASGGGGVPVTPSPFDAVTPTTPGVAPTVIA